MVKKLTAVMMLVLLAQPFCCCLFAVDIADQQSTDKSCCESNEASRQDSAPKHGGSDPCDCDTHEVRIMITPENSSPGAVVWKLDFIADQSALQKTLAAYRSETVVSGSFVSLSAFHPPGWRSCQDYCVYQL